MSSIIKNYRTLQGASVSIGIEKYTKIQEDLKVVVEEEVEAALPPIEYNVQLEEAKKEAEMIISNARIQAEMILEEAYTEKETLLKNVVEEVSSLKESAYEEIECEKTKVKEQIAKIKETAYKEKQSILQEAEPQIVEIIQTLLNAIVSQKIISGVEWLTLIVKRMIQDEHTEDELTISIPIELYEKYEVELSELSESLSIPVQVEASLELSGKSCLVETSSGNIYYDIENGLHQVIDEIKILSNICGGS